MNFLSKIVLLLALVSLVACSGGSSSVRKSKKQGDSKHAAEVNVQLAIGYIKRGQMDVARDKLDKAIADDPKYVPAYTTMAALMEMMEDSAKAEEFYKKALDVDEKNSDLLNNYGTFLCKYNKIDEAIEQFNKALANKFYETPERTHANMGYCLMVAEKPDYALAEKHLRKALKVNPNMESALLAMGELGIETRRFLMARAYMQRYHGRMKPSASSLWYQIQAEKALGDEKYFVKLSRDLLKYFPDSPEAKKLMELSSK
ncbi:MAG: type IV pilus biogenesis/stability protein PilW [Gammaproteobacteria bacterium]|nr:type IV pilus biogenesis/stability protein PilW [Gammaproteobacteria bacterium]